MIFALEDDTTLTVLADSAAASREYEAIDVEEGSVTFFSDDGTPLRPRFAKSLQRRFFGLVVEQDELVLEPAPPPDSNDAFAAALDRATSVNPNSQFGSVEAVREYVVARRRRAGG